MPGGRRIDHDRVEVLRAAAALPALLEEPDLAEDEDVFEAGGRGGDVVDEVRVGEHLRHALHVVLDVEVFGEGLFRDDVHAPDAGGDLRGVVTQRAPTEQPWKRPLLVHLRDAHLAAVARRDEGEGRGHRRLADAALARNDQDLRVEELVQEHATERMPFRPLPVATRF